MLAAPLLLLSFLVNRHYCCSSQSRQMNVLQPLWALLFGVAADCSNILSNHGFRMELCHPHDMRHLIQPLKCEPSSCTDDYDVLAEPSVSTNKKKNWSLLHKIQSNILQILVSESIPLKFVYHLLSKISDKLRSWNWKMPIDILLMTVPINQTLARKRESVCKLKNAKDCTSTFCNCLRVEQNEIIILVLG